MPLEPHMWQFPKKLDTVWRIKSRVTISSVGLISKLVVGFNNFKVVNKQTLIKNIQSTGNGRGLITVTNHHSCLDDPTLWGILGWKFVFGKLGEKLRWTLTADNICYTNTFNAKFFSLVKGIPVVRGDGVYQRGMDYAIEKLNNGEWVNIFPEARVNQTQELIRYKWGVGRMITEAKELPVVVPFFHLGMDSVSPNEGRFKYFPRICKKVTMVIGDAINFSDIVSQKDKLSPVEYRKKVTDLIQEKMAELQVTAEQIHNPAVS
ncbi:tafazzin-like [Mizuhopecten yessoensis]|uniref:Tafazzin family protein n=1 Tax=Mizuhopecten yessoensis TaxID=6573 RepID=A0A210QHR8_MIZYE|nr:tafazzin-like [Mizuhopecten yessoensis]OWF48313.1 Tafazzin [Mizuhopecten yessoensis]